MIPLHTIRAITAQAIADFHLDPVSADKLRAWSSRWEDYFLTEAEYTRRAVTTMTRNAAVHYGGRPLS